MPPTAPKPQAPKQSQSAAELNAATDASRASHTETPSAPPVTPEATPTSNGSPRRARKPREDRGPRPEHQFLISIHAALAAGVPVETVVPVLQYAKRAEGAAAWNMLRKTLDDFTRELTGEPEPVEDDAAADEDDEDNES